MASAALAGEAVSLHALRLFTVILFGRSLFAG